MAQTKVSKNEIDWSGFSNNIKSAVTSTARSLTNGAVADLGTNGATVSFTVATDCVAFVTVHVGSHSSTEFELSPVILRDGATYQIFNYAASVSGGAGSRFFQRSASAAVPLTAGSHTLSAGVLVVSATNQSVPTNAANITAIVLGNVTA